MKLTGEFLKEIRIKKKLEINYISQELNISVFILNAIEKDDVLDSIDSVFLIGHIRSYAKFLETDDDRIVEQYRIQHSYQNIKIKNEISKPIENINFFSIPKIASLFSIFFISLSFYFMFIEKDNFQPKYAMTPDLPENLEYKIEITDMQLSLKNISDLEVSRNLKIKNEELDMLISNNRNSLSSSSAIASTSSSIESNISDNMVTLKILDSTWIQLRDKLDNIILSKLMNQGDEYTYKASRNIFLTAGNAGNIIVLYNGKVKGKAGKSGEVIDSLIIDNNFNN